MPEPGDRNVPKPSDLKDSITAEKQQAERDKMLETAGKSTQAKANLRAVKEKKGIAKARVTWDKLFDVASETAKKGQQGYDTWVAAISAILIMCRSLNEAIHESNPIGSLLMKGAPLADQLVMTITALRIQAKKPEITLPDLQHHIEFTDGNKLFIPTPDKIMTRSDGHDFTAEQKTFIGQLMNDGIALWLAGNGYERKAGTNDEFVAHADNTIELTKPEFERLRTDPTTGLDAFLSGHFNMKMEHVPTPRPY